MIVNKLQELKAASRISKILKRNSIDIVHTMPGRIRLRSALWKNSPGTALQVIQHLEKEDRIFSTQYTAETGSLLITYDCSPASSDGQLERWIEQIEKVLRKVYE